MKNKDFKDLIISIDQARSIHKKEIRPTRVFKFEFKDVTRIRKSLHGGVSLQAR